VGATEQPEAARRRSVLVVDDSSVMRTALVAALESAGRWHLLPPAADGRTAVMRARASCPDVIVLDQQMPTLTGLETAPLLRNLCPNARIVMWSSEPAVKHLAGPAGIDVFVDKAAPLQHLLDSLDPCPPGR
jgi:chemotaxis response regulator CheB